MSEEGRPPPRMIRSILVANRAEIAARILTTARDLSLTTFALASANDDSHTLNASHILSLPSPSSYMDIDLLVSLAKEHNIDACHPGYGFLSESQEFAKRLWDEANCTIIGPGWDVLEATGDKLAARKLAESCNVPVLPATLAPSKSIDDLHAFANESGYPIMLKAVDGGGGRGIRLVRSERELESNAKRAMEESPSKSVFAERAAVFGFRHIEVQIVGDQHGNVRHLWERECSIQRRYQKIIELAPSTIEDRDFVSRIIDSAVSMAKKIKYSSLGTFEFLANPESKDFFFLEINPRIQVEHTVTESICNLDLIKIQIELAQGKQLQETDLVQLMDYQRSNQLPPLNLHSIQLRLTAENALADFSLSIGKISGFHFPSGNGVRVDTHLVHGHEAVVSADFDSLLAKFIITSPSFAESTQKSARVLQDTYVAGVKTNIQVLRGIVGSQSFREGKCDTKWLENNMEEILRSGNLISNESGVSHFTSQTWSAGSMSIPGMSSSTVLLRKGDAWDIKLTPRKSENSQTRQDEQSSSKSLQHHLKVYRVLRNEFPSSLSAEITYSTPSLAENEPSLYTLDLTATSASAESTMNASKHRRGDTSNPAHVVVPFAGRLVEVLVEEGDHVGEGDVVAVVQQMKMELEVRARKGGRVKWVTEAEEGEDIAEGMLAAELDAEEEARAKL